MEPDEDSKLRERRFIQWLDHIKQDAEAIFLLGDIFDFWFEYKYVVPRGFVRLLAKLNEIIEEGIPIHYFTGNHDMWVRDYLSSEIGVVLHRKPIELEFNNKKFLVGHGNGLGPVNFHDRFLTRIFSSRFLRFMYATLHPWWGIGFGKNWSVYNRMRHGWCEEFEDAGKEEIAIYATQCLQQKHYDFFIFGHRHLALDIRLMENSRYINTGEWISACTYAVFDGEDVSLQSFKGDSIWNNSKNIAN